MSLMKTETVVKFDTSKISPGNLIWARYKGWGAGQTGIVSDVSQDKLTVLHIAGKRAASNYYVILASEVAAGDWQVRWTSDLLTVEEWVNEP